MYRLQAVWPNGVQMSKLLTDPLEVLEEVRRLITDPVWTTSGDYPTVSIEPVEENNCGKE